MLYAVWSPEANTRRHGGILRHNGILWGWYYTYVCCDLIAVYTLLSETNNLYAWHELFAHGTRLIRMCAMTRSLVCCDSLAIRASLDEAKHMFVQHDSFTRAMWLICTRLARSLRFDERNQQFVCVTWLIHTCSMTHLHCDTTHAYVNDDSFARVPLVTHL